MELYNRLVANFNGRLAFAVTLVAFSAFNYGFDNQGFSAAQAMNPFAEQFGVFETSGKNAGTYQLQAYWLSLYSSVIFVGFGIGVVVGSMISSRFGRRVGMKVMCLWAMVAATVIVSSYSKWQLLAGRIMFNGYMGIELVTVPVYQAEVVPTPARGLVVSTQQFCILVGGLIMNLICLGTQTIPGNAAWRIPFGLFYLIPLIVLTGLHWVPESPRWLLVKGRREEALESLRILRQGRRSEAEIVLEIEMIETALEKEPEQGTFMELWRRDVIKRTCIAVGINFVQEISGQQITAKFGALMVKSIGTISPFVMTVVFAITNIIFAGTAMAFTDKWGRRPFLLTSIMTMCLALFALGAIGCYDYTDRKSLASASIFFLEMLSAGFAMGYGPITNVVMTEVVSLRLRDMSQRTAGFARVVANFVVGFTIPYMMDSIGLQMGFVFGSCCACGFIFTYFCIPECKGKSLEMIDQMFHERIPIRQFGKFQGDLENLTIENVIDDGEIKKEAEVEEIAV